MSTRFAVAILIGLLVNSCIPDVSPDRPKIYGREEFEKVLVGKTPDEVLQLIGEPYYMTPLGYVAAWNYLKITRGTTADEIDSSATVWFKHGVVTGIKFYR